jgi:putative oxidoreductase
MSRISRIPLRGVNKHSSFYRHSGLLGLFELFMYYITKRPQSHHDKGSQIISLCNLEPLCLCGYSFFSIFVFKFLTMKKLSKLLDTDSTPTLLIRIIVGLIFLSEGIQKFLYPDIIGAGRFAQIGFGDPGFWANFTGAFEITCGIFVLLGFFTRVASYTLLMIMFIAFLTTKLPILHDKGFWPMAHEYRTDFAMTLLLIYLMYYGGGNLSLDKRMREGKTA